MSLFEELLDDIVGVPVSLMSRIKPVPGYQISGTGRFVVDAVAASPVGASVA